MSITNLNVDIGAYNLGLHSAQSFLLAGERNLVSGLARPGTDEEKFQNLFKSLAADQKKLAKAYFERQANLSLPQRVKVLGDYTELKIEEVLNIETSARLINLRNPIGSDFAATRFTMSSFWDKIKKGEKSKKGTSKEATKLNLYLNSIKVERAQDRERWWSKKKVRLTDEVALGVITMDETGEISSSSHQLGQIREGKTKTYNRKLAGASILEGGNNFPKPYYFQVVAIERDKNKQWNNWIKELAKFAKKKASEELIAQGIIQGGAAVSIPIPPAVARIIASFVKGFIDKLIDWVANLAFDKDDIIQSRTIGKVINDYTKSKIVFGRNFIGSGGHWNISFTMAKE